MLQNQESRLKCFIFCASQVETWVMMLHSVSNVYLPLQTTS